MSDWLTGAGQFCKHVLAGSIAALWMVSTFAPAPAARAGLEDVRVRATDEGAELLLLYDSQPTAASATAVGGHVMVNLAGVIAEPASLPAPDGSGVRLVDVLQTGAVIELPADVSAASTEIFHHAVVVRIAHAGAAAPAPMASGAQGGDLLGLVTGKPLTAEALSAPAPKDDRERLALEAGSFIDALRKDPLSIEARLGLARVRMAEGKLDEARFYFGRVLALRTNEQARQEARTALMALASGEAR